jgi:hypothetical protein
MKCILLFLVLFITLNLSAQTDEQQLYKHKIEQYTKTKNAGNTLFAAGTLVTSVSLATLIVKLNDMNTTYEERDNSADVITLAAYGIGLGVDMIIGGIILQTVGNRKVKQYQKKYDLLSAGISVSPHSTGFSLVYRF